MILGLSAAPITLHEIDLMGAQFDIRGAVAASATDPKADESLETLASLLTALALVFADLTSALDPMLAARYGDIF
jgi:hypothetical protein